MGYGLEKGKASIPGPLIELIEGDTLHIEFENTMDVPVSLHAHGVDYDIANDGTQSARAMSNRAPRARTPGAPTPRAARGRHLARRAARATGTTTTMRSARTTAPAASARVSTAPLVVRRTGDLLPGEAVHDRLQRHDDQQQAGDASPNFRATVGDRVEIIMITHGEYYHTFHMHGHRWADNRTGLLAGPGDVSPVIDNKITGPADSFGFQVIAGETWGRARGCTTATSRATPTWVWPGCSWWQSRTGRFRGMSRTTR